MFDPIEEDGEYIELYNGSNRIVETTYLRLQYGEGELRKISPQTKNIFPNEHCLMLKTNSFAYEKLKQRVKCSFIGDERLPTTFQHRRKPYNPSWQWYIDRFSWVSHQKCINPPSVIPKEFLWNAEYTSCLLIPKWFSSASSLANYATPGLINSFQIMGNAWDKQWGYLLIIALLFAQ